MTDVIMAIFSDHRHCHCQCKVPVLRLAKRRPGISGYLPTLFRILLPGAFSNVSTIYQCVWSTRTGGDDFVPLGCSTFPDLPSPLRVQSSAASRAVDVCRDVVHTKDHRHTLEFSERTILITLTPMHKEFINPNVPLTFCPLGAHEVG